MHQDDPNDQKWTHREDGALLSPSTGLCLIEGDIDNYMQVTGDGNDDDENYDAYLGGAVPSLPHGSRSVHLGPCDDTVTLWTVGAGPGGFIQSLSSGDCLEVVVTELNRYLAAGKRLQTGRCQAINPGER